MTLEVKPWDDETDMKALEESVRSIEMEGLVWGASKLVPIGYGIRKLQITLVIGWHCSLVAQATNIDDRFSEDELVSLDELQEKVAEFEDYVQSTDVAAMQSTSAIFYISFRGVMDFCRRTVGDTISGHRREHLGMNVLLRRHESMYVMDVGNRWSLGCSIGSSSLSRSGLTMYSMSLEAVVNARRVLQCDCCVPQQTIH